MKTEFLASIDNTWSLFFVSDGVINKRIVGGYVKTTAEMILLPQVAEAFSVFKQTFNHIFIVTNQQGIGKGLMTELDLQVVHAYMLQQIATPIDAIYYCPTLAAENSLMRKPNIGMALQAKKDFPDVDFSKSVMVGDSPSDMQFGLNAGMKTVYVKGEEDFDGADLQVDTLYEFARLLKK